MGNPRGRWSDTDRRALADDTAAALDAMDARQSFASRSAAALRRRRRELRADPVAIDVAAALDHVGPEGADTAAVAALVGLSRSEAREALGALSEVGLAVAARGRSAGVVWFAPEWSGVGPVVDPWWSRLGRAAGAGVRWVFRPSRSIR